MSDLTSFAQRVAAITDQSSLVRIVRAGGMAGKKSALEAAAADLGGDRSMSGLRRKAALGAGFDFTGGTEVTINFRPAGLWLLASQGRRSSGQIRPRGRRGRKRALAGNGFGPVARSRYGPSRGLNTFDDAVVGARREVPQAAFKQFQSEVGRALRG